MRTAILLFFAVSTRVFVPTVGQSVVVDALHVDVLDVHTSSMQYATVRATEAGETRTLTLVPNADRIEVMNDHAVRLLDAPLRLSIGPAPSVAVDARAATRIARTKVASLRWTHFLVPQSCLLVRGTSWEISFPMSADMSVFVRVDAASGAILEIRKEGGY